MSDPFGRPQEELQIALASVARAIADSLEVREVWERVVEACCTLVPVDAMAISRLEPGDAVRVIAALGEARRFEGRVFQRAEFSTRLWPDGEHEPFIIVNDTEQWLDPSFPFDREAIEAGFRSWLRVPLLHRGKRIGFMSMAARQPGFFTEEHAHSLTLVAELVAVALIHEQLSTTLAGLRLMVDRIPALVCTMTAAGTVEHVNQRVLDYTGETFEELQDWHPLIHPDDLPLVVARWIHSVETGHPYEIEHRIRRADGVFRWFHAHGLPMVDAEGRIVRWYNLLTDIEDRKQAEEKLRRSEGYLAEAERLAHVGSSAFDVATGKIVHFSQEHFRMFGLDPEAGIPSFEVARDRIHPEDRDRILETFNRAVNERKDFEADHRTLLPDGTINYVHVIAHPTFDASGDLVEYVGTVMDVTERKRAEEKLSEALAELAHVSRVTTLGEMAASIAHEVDQPLSGVVINANACLRFLTGATPNLDEVRDGLQAIARDGRRASDVIGRIRALARRTTTEKEPLNINDVIREVVGLAEGEARRTRANVRTELTEDLPQVLGDRVQLQQVVLNLLLNGLDAMRAVADRPRELVISTQRDANDRVHVAVQDSGSGIDLQLAKRMFEAFYTTKRGGMGMGLSISRSIIEQHGGRLWALPNEGPGTTFHFTV